MGSWSEWASLGLRSLQPIPHENVVQSWFGFHAEIRIAPLPRWPFESFWLGLDCERDHDRWGGLNAAANAIYRVLGISREVERTSKFEGEARARARRP